ncbi:MAG TPA: hypothetical protein VMS92_10580 [Mycobacterium sp.]|nr:hypothetical protein [Mycobacterium sp.]
MTTSTTRKRFQYAATLLGALAFVALAPATANAQPVNNNEGGGCHYTDKDGYDIPLDEGQSVLVDGKTVTCTGGTITVSNAVKGGGVLQQQAGGVLAPVTQTPKKSPVFGNLPVFIAQR